MPGRGDPHSAMSGPMWMPTQPPTMATVLAWHPQPIPVLPVVAVVLLLTYAVGVVVLRLRGDRWPVGRSIMWAAGLAIVLCVSCTGIDGYGMELFSIHMIQHMVLNMLAPVFLVLGAPVTLLLRVLPGGSGSKGLARRTVLRVLHSTVASIVTHPVVTFALFVMSLYGLYFTALFDYLMGTWWGHNLMLIHFILIGYLYFWGIVGVDPSPRHSKRGLRAVSGPVLPVLELGATAPFHAFFGVVVMMSTTLMVHFYAVPMPGWNISPIADQGVGGGIAWGFTELPTLVVLGVLVLKWQKSDARKNAAAERRMARVGDVDMDDYNSYLQGLSSRDES